MGLSRRSSSGRGEAPIWPGFVDAFSSLLLVLMFVLTIFLVVQFVLRSTINEQTTRISAQTSQLDALNAQVQSLADALGLARSDAAKAHAQVGQLSNQLAQAQATVDQQSTLIATLNGQVQAGKKDLAAAEAKITDFQQQVASLLAAQKSDQSRIAALNGQVSDLSTARDRLQTEQQALQLAVAQARKEIDAKTEAARLAAARRDALEALIADLHQRISARDAAVAAAQTKLSEAEKQHLVDAAAAQALQDKLKNSDAELTAMTLKLEQARKKAEDTLTLLAAAQNARAVAEASAQQNLTEAQKQAGLLAAAQKALSQEQAQSTEAQRQVAVLNQQLAAVRAQLSSLQDALDASAAKDSAAQIQIDSLSKNLNQALARLAVEEKKRADLEAAARKRLEEQNQNLAGYRSEFFGKISKILAGRPGVKVVGDRFVFSSEVLFRSGSADLSDAGKAQIDQVVSVLDEVAKQIPPNINWILQVNGYTDATPITGNGPYADNWELSQARALSVVRYMIAKGFDPHHLAASGFGQYQPVATGDTPEARAQNRRIELKLTEK
ncbi:MAG: peptidoglycan -binding protein [Paracoccaceae bacterium]|nr:peptidoglycan -binding protein [Paracoccaceae bacterium]